MHASFAILFRYDFDVMKSLEQLNTAEETISCLRNDVYACNEARRNQHLRVGEKLLVSRRIRYAAAGLLPKRA